MTAKERLGIIERLRSERPWCYDENGQQFTYCPPGLADEAADEIERLRAALAEARREAMEKACRAVCHWCKVGKPLVEQPTSHWYHDLLEDGTAKCFASQIRLAWAEQTERR